MSTPEYNTCSTCMFFDDEHKWCDKQDEGVHPDFECNDHKEKVKHE